MSSNSRRKKTNPIRDSLDRTKKFFSKTLGTLKSFLYKKLSKKAPVFPDDGKKLNSKLEKFCRRFSGQCKSNEVKEKKEVKLPSNEQMKPDEQCSKSSFSFPDSSGLEDFREEKKSVKFSKEGPPKFLDADALAKKMKELEMMDVNDMDHVLDVEEVLHYYSRLTCPTYLEIVDKFFTDMHSEFRSLQRSKSVNSSMRMGSARLGSMRRLGSARMGSMRRMGSARIDSARLGVSTNFHSSMRNI